MQKTNQSAGGKTEKLSSVIELTNIRSKLNLPELAALIDSLTVDVKLIFKINTLREFLTFELSFLEVITRECSSVYYHAVILARHVQATQRHSPPIVGKK